MTTNYYTLKGIHIGKTASLASGNTFIWATDPVNIIRFHYFKDENGKRIDREEMTKILKAFPNNDYSHIGEKFS
jgi:hypothetical protein